MEVQIQEQQKALVGVRIAMARTKAGEAVSAKAQWEKDVQKAEQVPNAGEALKAGHRTPQTPKIGLKPDLQ